MCNIVIRPPKSNPCLWYIFQPVEHLFYCASCEAAWTSPDHSDHHGDGLPFPGISLYPEFVSCEEELDLVQQIDCTPWVESQSGRKKQVSNFHNTRLILGLCPANERQSYL